MTTYIALESRRYSNTFQLYKEIGGELKLIGVWFLPAEMYANIDYYITVDEITIWIYRLSRKG